MSSLSETKLHPKHLSADELEVLIAEVEAQQPFNTRFDRIMKFQRTHLVSFWTWYMFMWTLFPSKHTSFPFLLIILIIPIAWLYDKYISSKAPDLDITAAEMIRGFAAEPQQGVFGYYMKRTSKAFAKVSLVFVLLAASVFGIIFAARFHYIPEHLGQVLMAIVTLVFAAWCSYARNRQIGIYPTYGLCLWRARAMIGNPIYMIGLPLAFPGGWIFWSFTQMLIILDEMFLDISKDTSTSLGLIETYTIILFMFFLHHNFWASCHLRFRMWQAALAAETLLRKGLPAATSHPSQSSSTTGQSLGYVKNHYKKMVA